MSYLAAIVLYLVIYIAVCLISERFSPAVGIGGLVAMLFLARLLV